VTATALTECGIAAVGIANNVNYGEAINESIAPSRPDRDCAYRRRRKPHRRACSRDCRAPGIEDRVPAAQLGLLGDQPRGERQSAGIAVIRGHTAYQVPMYKMRREIPPLNRPGIPPIIVTWGGS
jgi:hypothetical protein